MGGHEHRYIPFALCDGGIDRKPGYTAVRTIKPGHRPDEVADLLLFYKRRRPGALAYLAPYRVMPVLGLAGKILPGQDRDGANDVWGQARQVQRCHALFDFSLDPAVRQEEFEASDLFSFGNWEFARFASISVRCQHHE